jgi:hypothetical protein
LESPYEQAFLLEMLLDYGSEEEQEILLGVVLRILLVTNIKVGRDDVIDERQMRSRLSQGNN